MMDFVDDEAISFDDFQTEFWAAFKKAQGDTTKINDDTPQELRPTRALLSRQILKSDKHKQYLLSLLAFFESVVPKDLLHDDSVEYDLREFRRALDRLVKNKLVLTEIDLLQELNEKTGKKTDIVYYSLHGFIKEIIRDVLPKFEEIYPVVLVKIADRMDSEIRTSWEKKLFEKQLALADCWERIETYFVEKPKGINFQSHLDFAEFWKAMALQETAFSANVKLSQEEISKRVKNAEKLYRKIIDKYPAFAVAYNNLGLLLAKDESRLEEAEESYRKTIELNPTYALAYNNLGFLLYKQSTIDEAKRLFQTSAELDKGQVNSRISLAAIYKKQGDQKESEKYAEQAKALLKEDSYYNLACLNSVLDEKDESFKYLKLAIEKSSRYKSIAKTDPDLEWIRGDKRFWEIVGRDNE